MDELASIPTEWHAVFVNSLDHSTLSVCDIMGIQNGPDYVIHAFIQDTVDRDFYDSKKIIYCFFFKNSEDATYFKLATK